MSQNKKAQEFSREFKIKAAERMLAGESARALSQELKVLRKSLYEWKDAYILQGPLGLKKRGRPRRDWKAASLPDPESARAELLQARQRIAELEQKVGKQALELDFFAEALRRVDASLKQESEERGKKSIRSSDNKRSKAN